jgi:hypothetical protein
VKILFFTDCSKSELRKFCVTGHGCENTQKDRVEFLLTNMAQVRVCQLKKNLGISNTLCRKEKDSVGHAKVVQNSTVTKNIISSNSFLLPPCRKSKEC